MDDAAHGKSVVAPYGLLDVSHWQMKNKQQTMNPAQLERAAGLFTTLSETSRLLLLQALMRGPKTVSELIEETGMKQGNVSKQLGILHTARLVGRQRDGNFVYYSISEPMIFDLCHLVCETLREQVKRDVAELAS
jgi:DNA-binding transcriptional ArsR family regulator